MTLTSAPAERLSDTITLRMETGSTTALARGEMLVDSTTARSDHLSVGDLAPVAVRRHRSHDGPHRRYLRRRTPSSGSFLGGSITTYFRTHFTNERPDAVLLRTNGSSSVDNRVKIALSGYPNVQVQTRAQFEQAQTNSINQLLGSVLDALLALAVLIALLGIVNTMMLSVFERTREIGLPRAVATAGGARCATWLALNRRSSRSSAPSSAS